MTGRVCRADGVSVAVRRDAHSLNQVAPGTELNFDETSKSPLGAMPGSSQPIVVTSCEDSIVSAT